MLMSRPKIVAVIALCGHQAYGERDKGVTMKHSSRMISIGISVGIFAASLAVIPVAQAYPPGTNMAMSASSSSRTTGQSVSFSVSRVKPGCVVTFRVPGVVVKTSTANASGWAYASVEFSTAGFYHANASTASGACEGQSASVTVQVVARAPSAPMSFRASSPGSGRITLSWSSNCDCGGSPFAYWTAYVTKSGNQRVRSLETTRNGANFVGLARGYYYVSVRVTNAAGKLSPTTSVVGISVR